VGPASARSQPCDDDRRFKAFGSKFLSSGTIAVWEEGFRRAGLAEE
jgi:hypothetical protein